MGIKLRTTVFFKQRDYTVLVRNQTHDFYLSQPTSSPSPLLNSLPSYLHRSLAPPVDKILPHLLTSSNSAAFWHPQWTKYLLNSSPPQLRCSLVPPVEKTFSTPSSSPNHLLSSDALWHSQWTKYLLKFSPPQLCRSLLPLVDKIPLQLLTSLTPPLSGAPSGPYHWSGAPQVAQTLLCGDFKWLKPLLCGDPSGPHHALWRPKWPKPCSVAPQVALSGTYRGNLLRSLAPLAETPTK